MRSHRVTIRLRHDGQETTKPEGIRTNLPTLDSSVVSRVGELDPQ